MVDYFKQAAKLHYGHRKKDDVKLTLQYGKENAVNLPHKWLKNERAINVWLRRRRCWRKYEATSLTSSASLHCENEKAFF